MSGQEIFPPRSPKLTSVWRTSLPSPRKSSVDVMPSAGQATNVFAGTVVPALSQPDAASTVIVSPKSRKYTRSTPQTAAGQRSMVMELFSVSETNSRN